MNPTIKIKIEDFINCAIEKLQEKSILTTAVDKESVELLIVRHDGERHIDEYPDYVQFTINIPNK